MPRAPGVRWSDRDRCWISDCGERTGDRSGRPRRKRVYFREDEDGPIPYGPRPRSEGYRRAVRALERHLAGQAERERPAGPAPPTVLELIRAFRAEQATRVRRGEIAARSAKVAGEALLSWADWPEADPIGFRPADAVTAGDLERWIEQLHAEGRSPHYVRRLVGTVKGLWAWAVDAEHLGRDPLRKVRRPRAPKGTGRRPDREAWRRWRRAKWAEARAHSRRSRRRTTDRVTLLLVRAIGDTGARPEELCAARWAELDGQLLALVPGEHKNDGHGKMRAVFFPPWWRWALRWLKARGHPEYLFWHKYVCPRKPGIERRGSPEHGAPWTSNALAKKLKKWGMPCWPYDLRRLVASELADGGLDYRRIADLLGNSEDLVREVYVRRELASLRAEFDRVRVRARRRPADRAEG